MGKALTIKFDDIISITTLKFLKSGYFKPYTNETMAWTLGDQVISMEFWTFPFPRKCIEYQFNDGGPIQVIPLIYTYGEPHGGRIFWFQCPECGAKRNTLGLVHGAFLCRQCHGLSYKPKGPGVVARRRGVHQRYLAKPLL